MIAYKVLRRGNEIHELGKGYRVTSELLSLIARGKASITYHSKDIPIGTWILPPWFALKYGYGIAVFMDKEKALQYAYDFDGEAWIVEVKDELPLPNSIYDVGDCSEVEESIFEEKHDMTGFTWPHSTKIFTRVRLLAPVRGRFV